jgi:hypothetical protein
VGLHGLVGDEQLAGDLGVGSSAGDLVQYVDLALCELLELGRGVGPGWWAADEGLDEPACDLRCEERVACDGGADGSDELLRSGALEQEAARARTQGLVDVLVEVECGEDEHAQRTRPQVQHPPGGLEAVDARHADVHEHDIGAISAREFQCGASVFHVGGDLDVALRLEDHAQAAAHERFVVGDQDTDHNRTRSSGSRARRA